MGLHFLTTLAALGSSVWLSLSDSLCGIKGGPSLQSRIVNGVEATRCEWPWQAGLHNGGGQFCGGTLIATDWVLTAAHCVEGGGDFNIVLGDHDVTEVEDTEVQLEVEAVFAHPSYEPSTVSYDFALVKLATPASEGECVRPACLPEADEALPIGEDCYVTGWGTLSSGGGSPDVLQEASVAPIEASECKSRYEGWTISITDLMLDVMFCAQGSRNGSPTDSCQGDSGGPLVCAKSDESYTLFGVASWGNGCALADFPGVYATVASVIPWITAYLGRLSPEFPPGSMWVVTSGNCTLDEELCIRSPNYPGNYDHNSECTIQINGSLAEPIQVDYFFTEAGYDLLWVNGVGFSGPTSPDGLIPEGVIIWQADSSVADAGWRLCQDLLELPPQLLFRSSGLASTYSNTWLGWYMEGYFGTQADGQSRLTYGKQTEYDELCLFSIIFRDSSGTYAHYELAKQFYGMTLLQIVWECMPDDPNNRTNSGVGLWLHGHCDEVGYLRDSYGHNFSSYLRLGVGDGTSSPHEGNDWALFMPVMGNGGGDFQANDIWAFASKGVTCAGHQNMVHIEGYKARSCWRPHNSTTDV